MPESWITGIKFTDADVLNPDEFPATGVGCNNYKAFLLHDHAFTVCVVFAENEQDALDLAADGGKLDGFLVTPGEYEDYPDGEGLSYLGNASKEYDIAGLGVLQLPKVPFSFCALYNATVS